MIDAASFAISYNAFWNDFAPTCEYFVRRLNLEGVERFEPPIGKSSASKRAIIAEFAFSLFVERKKNNIPGIKKKPENVIQEAAWLETEKRLAPYAVEGLNLSRDFDKDESDEVDAIAKTLFRFFTNDGRELILRPMFSGCGYIDASEGDILFGDTIYEIKTVDRLFRSNDVRQVITYAALNFASKQFSIENIGLFNPRSGQYCEIPLEHVCREISGRPAQELLAAIIQAVSSGEISR